jgi:hypothetical protein
VGIIASSAFNLDSRYSLLSLSLSLSALDAHLPSFFFSFISLSLFHDLIMTSAHSPLHFLAQVACDVVSPANSPYIDNDGLSAGSPSASSATSIDISCSPNTISTPCPLRHSNVYSDASSPSPPRRKTAKRPNPDHLLQIKFKQQMRAKRQTLMEKAMRIKSLDNSPVNDHQLLVLRMVYDQITMYPPESWMVLLAIVIRR